MSLIHNTKCECGHQNHVGTVLCESCGKPLLNEEEHSSEPLEMRYDGAARRSQKSNPGVIDRVWNFFSSVKIAIYLILITLVAASLGTIYPQENTFVSSNADFASYYKDTYGVTGQIYYALGLSHTYDSWWFIGLLVMIGTSLVVCSLDRVLPLYKALSKQQIRKHLQFIRRQKTVYTGTIEADSGEWIQSFANALKRKRYRVHIDGTALLAEKNRFSRWGPYINHIGLIVFLLSILARSLPGWQMDAYVSVPDGETVAIEGTDYFVKNDKFTVVYYKDDELPEELRGKARAKLYETKAILYKCTSQCDDPVKKPVLQEVYQHDIKVNSPLKYKGLKLYQYDYDLTPRLKSVSPVITDKHTGQSYGPFDLPMKDAPLDYTVGPYTLKLYANFMDFALDDKGNPTTLGRDPNAPAFVFIVKGPGLAQDGVPYMYFPMEKDKVKFGQDQINGDLANQIEIHVDGMENVHYSESATYLNVRIDRAMNFIWIGAVISMIGLLMGAYWHHRRIWLRIDGSELSLGAHTNKNWYGMRSDVASALRKAGIEVDPKTLDNGGNKA
ncbi:cytochrome c biogenesis protein ResB [Paenibacillus protaetiae]|uniref:Cytochrome c biogenesis protein ResB n=1 Tax=Paenibacillus protaetiae TaxID=2509456 RepID=A0A4P6F6Z8_9BACL|nr:cytochrome c biogenesis protein ResB [Paenibacillus protaetiae]QAY66198.1 cytochrome c biogenesis protein ResB [Paenibacillus protaetiae]